MNRYLIAILAFLVLPSTTSAADWEFVESFNGGPGGFEPAGFHPLDSGGLDNPGWFMESNGELQFADGGLRFQHQGQESQSTLLSRDLGEIGSFAARVEILSVDLGETDPFEPANASSRLAFRHFIGFGALSMQIMPTPMDDQWELSLVTSGPRPQQHLVSKGDHLALEIIFAADTSQVRYRYDNDANDELPPQEFGPIEFFHSGNFEHRTALWTDAVGAPHRVADGLLDHWSVSANAVLGDFDDDNLLTVADVDLLSTRIREGPYIASYDLNGDKNLSASDVRTWAEDLKGTYLGDTNLDGEFNSTDLVQAFRAGQYEDGIELNSTWETGDWDADGEFGSGDIVAAFVAGGYELGPHRAFNAVPEPTSMSLLIAGLTVVFAVSKTRRRQI